jgi:hypothetical protein
VKAETCRATWSRVRRDLAAEAELAAARLAGVEAKPAPRTLVESVRITSTPAHEEQTQASGLESLSAELAEVLRADRLASESLADDLEEPLPIETPPPATADQPRQTAAGFWGRMSGRSE